MGGVAGYSVAGFTTGSTVQIFVNGVFYGTTTTDASGSAVLNIVWSDPHVSINGGPLVAVNYGAVSIGVTGTSSTGGIKNVNGSFNLVESATLAATGFSSGVWLMIGSGLLLLSGLFVTRIRNLRQTSSRVPSSH